MLHHQSLLSFLQDYKKTLDNCIAYSNQNSLSEKAPSEGISLQPFTVAQIHKGVNYSKTYQGGNQDIGVLPSKGVTISIVNLYQV